MVPHADTLRKIQVEHGVTGSFKDRPLADWLQKHNPTDEQYDKVTHLYAHLYTDLYAHLDLYAFIFPKGHLLKNYLGTNPFY